MNIEKSLKSILKRKMKFTSSLLVVFLILGFAVFSAEIISNDQDIIIKETISNSNGAVEITDSFNGKVLSIDKDFINNANIEVRLESTAGNTTLPGINETASTSFKNSGNGIQTVNNVENNKNIKINLSGRGGKADASNALASTKASGNGIYNGGNIKNNGYIFTELELQGGESSSVNQDTAFASATSNESGNGLYNVGKVENNGIISSKLGLEGGISKAVTKYYVATAEATDSGNGIYYSGDIANSGTISSDLKLRGGTSSGTSIPSSAIAIYSGNSVSNSGNINNQGNIKSTLSLTDGNSELEKAVFNSSYSGNAVQNSMNIENTGNINTNFGLYADMNTINLKSEYSGNAIHNVKEIVNKGAISSGMIFIGGSTSLGVGKSEMYAILSGNGILKSEKIVNNGNIQSSLEFSGGRISSITPMIPSATLDEKIQNTSNGIFSSQDIENNGNIKTYINASSSEINIKEKTEIILNTNLSTSGNGMATASRNSKFGVINNGNIGINLNSKISNITSENSKVTVRLIYSRTGNGIDSFGFVKNNGYINTKITSLEEIINSKKEEATINNIVSMTGNALLEITDTENNGYLHSDLLIKGTSGSNSEKKIENSISFTNSGNSFSAASADKINNNGRMNSNIKAIGGKVTSMVGGANVSLLSSSSGNGLDNFKNAINKGLISGSSILNGGESHSTLKPEAGNDSIESGNGAKTNNFLALENEGVLSGYSSQKKGTINATKFDYVSKTLSGNGFILPDNLRDKNTITNQGVIKGSQSAIAAKNELKFKYTTVKNYGILSGREIFGNDEEFHKNDNHTIASPDKNLQGLTLSPTIATNSGIHIKLGTDLNQDDYVRKDLNNNVIIENIFNAGGIVNEHESFNVDINKTILNTAITNKGNIANPNYDSSKDISGTSNSFKDYIINGAGNEFGVLNLTDNSSINLENSTVNSYKTAIYLNNNITLNSKDSVFNGGGLRGKDPVIFSKGNGNNINLSGNSFVNGDLTNNGNDLKLSLKDTTKMNGDIYLTGDRGEISINNEVIINGNLTSKGEETKILFDGSDILLNGNLSVEGNKSDIALKGNTKINGDILLKGNDSNLSIDSSTKFNGDISADSASKNNKLQLGNVSSGELNIFGKIDNFSNISIRGKVNLFEDASINKGDINISDGKLVVRIDAEERDGEGKIKGHALYNHNGKITYLNTNFNRLFSTNDIDNDSILLFKVSGLSVDEIIAMNGTDISSLTNGQIGTLSLLHTGIKTASGDVKISIKNWEDFTPAHFSNELGEIYESIKKSNQIGLLSSTVDLTDGRTDSLDELISLLDQIYANNPYSYGGLMSKYNSDMFREGIYSSSTIMPEVKEYITTGQILYSYNEYRDMDQNYYYDGKSQNNSYSSYSTTNGLLGTVEYGIKPNESLGFAIGGAKQKLHMDHSSNLEGDAVYLGLFYKKNIDKFKFITGLGYQYSMYDAERKISNKYQGFKNEGDFNTNSLNVYTEAKYILAEDKGWSVEPKLKLSYTYVAQDSVSEDNAPLAIDVDKTNYNYFDTEVGVDFVKEVAIPQGKIKGISNVSYINSQGTSDKDLTGKMKNSTDFGIQGQVLNKNNGKIGIALELEKENGISYSVGTDLIFSEKNQKNVNAKIGIGYKF